MRPFMERSFRPDLQHIRGHLGDLLSERGFQGYEVKYGNVERADFPFPVTYISKDSLDKDVVPASVFLYGLEKGRWCI